MASLTTHLFPGGVSIGSNLLKTVKRVMAGETAASCRPRCSVVSGLAEVRLAALGSIGELLRGAATLRVKDGNAGPLCRFSKEHPEQWISPEIVEAILAGRQPPGLTMARAMQLFPVGWRDQTFR